MLCLIVPIPSDDNCKLVELLASLNLEFTVTNSSFSSVMALIYNPTAKPSPPSKSKTAKTVIINGNTEIHSKLATNGYSNYSVTVKSFFDLVLELFSQSFDLNESIDSFTPTSCNIVEESDDEKYFSARQSPVQTSTNMEDTDDQYYSPHENYDGSDYEPAPKRKRYHNKYGGICCEYLQQCQNCRKHVLPESNFSSFDILLHAFFHNQMYRYRCISCKIEWNNQEKRHKFGCTEPKIIDILQFPNIPSLLISSSLKCFPKAVQELKAKGQWNF